MTHLAPAEFSDRLVPRFPTAPAPQAPDRAEPAAEALDLQASAAFCQFTETSPVGARGEAKAVPLVRPSAGGTAVELPDHVMVLMRAVAGYERCDNARAIEIALKEYATAIGAGLLARAMADYDGDLVDLPAHARPAANRFRGGGP